MLAALVVVVLAATFALIVVAAVHSSQLVVRSDAAGWRAAALEGRALASAAAELRWRPAVTAGSIQGEDGAGGTWRVVWAPAPATAGGAWPRLRARAETQAVSARRHQDLTLELRTEPWAAGVTCAGDADVTAELTVSGSGVYVGGCLRGRENVLFTADAGLVTGDGRPADGVYGHAFPSAAVHGGAGIFARGAEIHESGASTAFPDDTDRHEGVAVAPGWLQGPSPEFLAAAREAALTSGPWCRDDRLRLDLAPPAAAGVGNGGHCLLAAGADEVVIEGAAAPAAGRLLVVVRGDAVVGAPGETVVLTGGLVVLGRLTVRGRLDLTGHLHAGALDISAPVRIVVPGDWRHRSLAGATVVTVVEREG
jgi:hypothetical protein